MAYQIEDYLVSIPEMFDDFMSHPWQKLAFWASKAHERHNRNTLAFQQSPWGKKLKRKNRKRMTNLINEIRAQHSETLKNMGFPLRTNSAGTSTSPQPSRAKGLPKSRPTPTHKTVTVPCATCGGRHLAGLSSCSSQTKLKVA